MSGTILTFSEDITNAEAPPPLPVGPYPAEIIGAQRRTSPTTGKDYAQIMLRINSESYPADYTDGDPDGTVISYNRLQMEDNAANRHRWRVFLEKCGGPLGRSIDLNALVGLSCTVDITHQEYEGEQRPQVARILAP